MKGVPAGRRKMARTFPTRFPSPRRGLRRFGNANPQLKLAAIVCRLCEAETAAGRARHSVRAVVANPNALVGNGGRLQRPAVRGLTAHFTFVAARKIRSSP